MGSSGFKLTPKKTGLAAMLEEKKKKEAEALVQQKKEKALEKPIEFVSAEAAREKIRIIFDDSDSMSGKPIENAIEGCIEFMRNCTLNETAVAIHPMCYKSDELQTLTANLPELAAKVKRIPATGSTPMFETWNEAMSEKPRATRYIIFSDGVPNGTYEKESTIAKCRELNTPCDTVYIGTEGGFGASLLKEIAERTGGIFLLFEPGKVNFARAFKYLSPGLRLQLMDENTKKLLEEGKL